MLPATARKDDLVEVTKEGNEYYGMVGKLVAKELQDRAVVDIFGKQIYFERSDLCMKARVGTSKHRELNEYLEEMSTKHLTRSDYDELINMAIYFQEFEWATELVNRKYKKR